MLYHPNQGFPDSASGKEPQEESTCGKAQNPCVTILSRCSGAREPQLLKPAWSRAREPQLLSPRAATTEACAPRSRAPRQEKPLQWE